jgi:hypothetical protein
MSAPTQRELIGVTEYENQTWRELDYFVHVAPGAPVEKLTPCNWIAWMVGALKSIS